MSEDLAATLLLELRLRAFAPTDVLAAAAGVSPTVVASALGVYESEHWVQRRDGRVVGWSLTAAGRRHGRDLLVSELAAADATDAVARVLRAWDEPPPTATAAREPAGGN